MDNEFKPGDGSIEDMFWQIGTAFNHQEAETAAQGVQPMGRIILEPERFSNEEPTQTPIEIALGIDENGMTTARKLYEFLELNPGNYSRWSKRNIAENEFAEENVDYWAVFPKEERNFNPCPTQDYKLTAHFAKKLSMMQKTERGEAARDYFIKVEDKAKDMVRMFQEAQHSPMKLLELHYEAIKQADKKAELALDKTGKLAEQFSQFEMNLPLFPEEAEDITKAVKKRVIEVLGGKESRAYCDKGFRRRVFINIYAVLKEHFSVHQYKCIKRCKADKALELIASYVLPIDLREEAARINGRGSATL